jgi:hypothetical protein
MKYALFLLFVLFGLAACEKTISIEPAIREPLLVVDGSIEDGQPPMILLSRSVNYFSTISPEILAASIVKGAQLTLHNGSRQVALKEYTVPIAGNFSISYYSTDTTDPAAQMPGEQEKTYTLHITADNKTFTAVTSIPKLTKRIDSLWWEAIPRADDTTRVWLMAKVTDPPGYGNYIRYFTRTNKVPAFHPGDNSVFDDQVVDGTTYDIQVEQGKDRNNPEDHRRSFQRGDTATVKFANIDKASYDFWRTIEFGYQSVGNPFASPTRVLGNVNNGALGAFCGYAIQYKTLIIPK